MSPSSLGWCGLLDDTLAGWPVPGRSSPESVRNIFLIIYLQRQTLYAVLFPTSRRNGCYFRLLSPESRFHAAQRGARIFPLGRAMTKICDMEGVREHAEGFSLELCRDEATGRLVVQTWSEGE